MSCLKIPSPQNYAYINKTRICLLFIVLRLLADHYKATVVHSRVHHLLTDMIIHDHDVLLTHYGGRGQSNVP